jgi:hypothetical protein
MQSASDEHPPHAETTVHPATSSHVTTASSPTWSQRSPGCAAAQATALGPLSVVSENDEGSTASSQAALMIIASVHLGRRVYAMTSSNILASSNKRARGLQQHGDHSSAGGARYDPRRRNSTACSITPPAPQDRSGGSGRDARGRLPR